MFGYDMKKSFAELFFLIIAGVLSGYINGLLGTGGGIILVFVLSAVMTQSRAYSSRDVFATVIAAILPMSAVSVVFYLNSGSVSINDAAPYLLSGILGGLCGGLILERINLRFLKKLFAAMVVYAGLKMLMN